MTPTSTDNDEDAGKTPLIRSGHYRMHSDTDTIDSLDGAEWRGAAGY
jgi:hypothetical protein